MRSCKGCIHYRNTKNCKDITCHDKNMECKGGRTQAGLICMECLFHNTEQCSHPEESEMFAAACSDFHKSWGYQTYTEKEIEVSSLASKEILEKLTEAVDMFINFPEEKLIRWSDYSDTLKGRYTDDKYKYDSRPCMGYHELYGLADEFRFGFWDSVHETWDTNFVKEVLSIAENNNIPVLLLISESNYKPTWWVSDEEEPKELSKDYSDILAKINSHRDLSISKIDVCSVGEWLRSDEPFIGDKHATTFVRNLDKIYLRIDMTLSERKYDKKFGCHGCSYVGCDEAGASMCDIYY